MCFNSLPLLAAPDGDFADFLDWPGSLRLVVRMVFAVALGGVLGWQREAIGKDAGFRTYMMVSLASAFFTSVVVTSGMSDDAMSRVFQGLLTGIGFLGAGAILKLPGEQKIEGLTTAAGIWLTSIIGIAVGLGRLGLATLATIFAFGIFQLFAPWSRRIEESQADSPRSRKS